MKQLVLSIILAIVSMSISYANTCELSWIPTLEREDGTPMTSDEIKHYRVQFKYGVEWVEPFKPTIKLTKSWFNNNKPCPSCTEVRVIVVDTGDRVSSPAYPICPPAEPIICTPQ